MGSEMCIRDSSEDEVDSGAVDSDDCGVCCCCDDGNSSTVGSSSSEIHKIKRLIFNLLYITVRNVLIFNLA